jgi:hypothetical protein
MEHMNKPAARRQIDLTMAISFSIPEKHTKAVVADHGLNGVTTGS